MADESEDADGTSPHGFESDEPSKDEEFSILEHLTGVPASGSKKPSNQTGVAAQYPRSRESRRAPSPPVAAGPSGTSTRSSARITRSSPRDVETEQVLAPPAALKAKPAAKTKRAAASARTAKLSQSLWQHIIGYIRNAESLLSLALSSKTMYELVSALPDWHVLLLEGADRLCFTTFPIMRGARILINKVR